MRKLLLEACHQVARRDNKTLSAAQYKALRRRYRTILTQAKRELPEIPPRVPGHRGRVVKFDAHNLRERLRTYEAKVLRFAEDPDVSFTNNRAERDLRMSKVKQKVSGCLPNRKIRPRPCLLAHLKLPAIRRRSGLQLARRHPDRTRRRRRRPDRRPSKGTKSNHEPEIKAGEQSPFGMFI